MKKYPKTKIFLLTSLLVTIAPAYAQQPVGHWLDELTVKGVLTNGWQRALNTDKDPANRNQWNRFNGGLGFGVGGLYGGLTETQLPTQFAQVVRYPPVFVSKKQIEVTNDTEAAATSVHTLEFLHVQTVKDQSMISGSIRAGADISFKVSAATFSLGTDTDGKLSQDYIRTSVTSNKKVALKQENFSTTATVTVPPKSTLVVTLACEEEKVDVAYRTLVKLSGTSSTWFDSRVNSHYNYNNSVETVIAHVAPLPRDWQIGLDGFVYVAAATGTLTAEQSTKCHVVTEDHTRLRSLNTAVVPVARATSLTALLPKGASLVCASIDIGTHSFNPGGGALTPIPGSVGSGTGATWGACDQFKRQNMPTPDCK